MRSKAKILIAILIGITSVFVIPNVVPTLSDIGVVQAATTVKLNATSKTLNVKETYTLKVSGTTQKVKWKSSNTNVATVLSSGKVTAKRPGTAVITAKVGNSQYKCTVKIESPKINQTKKTLKVNGTCNLKINGTTQKVKWTSSNTSVATVTSGGKVTAKKAGTATIIAKIGGSQYKCTIKVEGPKTVQVGKTYVRRVYNPYYTNGYFDEKVIFKAGNKILYREIRGMEYADWTGTYTIKNGVVTAKVSYDNEMSYGKATIKFIIKDKKTVTCCGHIYKIR